MVTEREIEDARRAMRALDAGNSKPPNLDAYRRWKRKSRNKKLVLAALIFIAVTVLLLKADLDLSRLNTWVEGLQESSSSASISNTSTATAGHAGNYKVVRIVDGDTVYLRESGDQVKVRLVCIDAPESRQAYGRASKSHLAKLIGGQYVQLEDRGKDRYGRTLGLIKANGYDMNWQMIKDGYAWDYDRYTCGRSYQKAEKAAREAKRGLWADPNPVPPWEYRRR